jgi:hypothetical protein
MNAELSAEEPFVNVSSAAGLQLHLEFAASVLKKAAPRRPKAWGDENRPQLSPTAPRLRTLLI